MLNEISETRVSQVERYAEEAFTGQQDYRKELDAEYHASIARNTAELNTKVHHEVVLHESFIAQHTSGVHHEE